MTAQAYERITGRVTALGAVAGREDFVFRPGDRVVGDAAAAGLALGGLSGAAASASASQADAADAVMNFQCRVGEHLVTGCLGSVGFADGDEVSVAGHWQGEVFVAGAVARASDRTVWMPPHSGRGHRAFLHALLTRWGTACVLAPMLFAFLMDVTSEQPAGWQWWGMQTVICSGMLLLVVGLTASRVYPYAVMSTALFEALGWPSGRWINLPRITRQYLRQAPDEIRRFHPFTPWVFRY